MCEEITYPFINSHLWELDKYFHITLYWACDYLPMLGFKLIPVSKTGPIRGHVIWEQYIWTNTASMNTDEMQFSIQWLEHSPCWYGFLWMGIWDNPRGRSLLYELPSRWSYFHLCWFVCLSVCLSDCLPVSLFVRLYARRLAILQTIAWMDFHEIPRIFSAWDK